MGSRTCLEEDEIVAELEKVKQNINETEGKIQILVLKKCKLEKTFADLKSKHNKCLEAKLYGKDWESTNYEWSPEIQKTLKTAFKMDKFRPYQLAAINAVMSGQDCLLLMPTGGGKSLCYQLPAKVLKGLTLVVSPLVSLMEDQVMALQELNYPAAMLSASVSLKESRTMMKSMYDKACPFKLLYVTPEKLSKSKIFLSSLQKAYECGMFSLLAIDEVHCCSQWGHDFRRDYKILGIMKRQFPKVPILGVTATATPEILADVKNFLALEGCLSFKVPFDRPNLKYQVRVKPAKGEDVINGLVKLLKGKFKGQSGIIYCFTVKESDQIASDLRKEGIKAASYHAQLDPAERSHAHKKWASNSIQVVVATIAFGMGIDKPDVRFVIHHSIAKSMESYYQESGRAGRDDQPADCILFYRVPDLFRLSTMVNEDRKALKKLYQMIEYCLDLTRCRRVIIAQHFDEKWNKTECNKMCDHCKGNVRQAKEEDMTKQCLYIFDIIQHCTKLKQRITGPKLVTILLGKCPSNLKPPKRRAPILDQDTYERLLALMLAEEYLKESFSFTPYTTLSYIEIGDLYEDIPLSSVTFSFIMPTTEKSPRSNPDSSHSSALTPVVDKDTVKKPPPSASHDSNQNLKRQKVAESKSSNGESKKLKKSPQTANFKDITVEQVIRIGARPDVVDLLEDSSSSAAESVTVTGPTIVLSDSD